MTDPTTDGYRAACMPPTIDTRTYHDAGTLAAAAATRPRTLDATIVLADRTWCWQLDHDAQPADFFDGPVHGPWHTPAIERLARLTPMEPALYALDRAYRTGDTRPTSYR